MEKLVHNGLDLADSSTLIANPAHRSPSVLEKSTKNQFLPVGIVEKLVHNGLDLADSSKLTPNSAHWSPLALEKTTKNQFQPMGRGEARGYDPHRRRRRGALEARGRRTGGGSDEGATAAPRTKAQRGRWRLAAVVSQGRIESRGSEPDRARARRSRGAIGRLMTSVSLYFFMHSFLHLSLLDFLCNSSMFFVI
jgi:hypothetical protein